MMKAKDLNKLDLITMQEDLMYHIANIGYVLEGEMEAGDPARKLLVSMEHSISNTLEKLEQLQILERKTA